ncbi:glutamate-gated chloride channel-like isoform X1 [Penaeus monodon]|uniref:glutamate-gated chloride channel-like isoform X1 n=1 Tax=Penaeus monodon TaxID=6687 RepID=UPI0018A7BE4F|nr:glutamate-gated chloride channel-like isoform X1 [Penaeus monodon]
MWRLLVVTLFVLGTALSAGAANGAPEGQATEMVLEMLRDQENYNSAVRPSVNGGATEVKVQMYIREIDVDDTNMKAEFDLTFRMVWNDPRLTYDAPGVSYVNILTPHLAWLPDAFFKNAITTQLESVYPESYLRVYPNGRLIYSTRLSLKQNCPMNFARFPHDTQDCKIQVASYGYTADEVFFIFDEEVQIGKDLHVEKFHMENIGDNMFSYCTTKTATGEYSCVQITISIRRAFGTYLLEWYLPVIFLVFVAYFAFLIPGDQFLARLLLTLIPLISLASFSYSFRQSLALVPYARALDIFTGISLIVIFATLVHVIMCYIKGGQKCNVAADEAQRGGSDEEAPKELSEEPSAFRRAMNKVMKRAEFLSRCILVGFYVFFLFVYFAAYCGTG